MFMEIRKDDVFPSKKVARVVARSCLRLGGVLVREYDGNIV